MKEFRFTAVLYAVFLLAGVFVIGVSTGLNMQKRSLETNEVYRNLICEEVLVKMSC